MSISCILVDDEELALEELQFLLNSDLDVDVVAEGRNGVDAIRLVRKLKPDLIFLDIQMPGLNGFQVLHELVKENNLPQVIFVTAFDQYAVKAFEVNAVDYILKPVEKSRLVQAVDRAKMNLQSNANVNDKLKSLLEMMGPVFPKKTKLLIKENNRHLMVDSDEVVFASLSDGSVVVTTDKIQGKTQFRTLEELQLNLNQQVFWRVHRSFLVNIDKIKEVVPWFNRTLQLKMLDKSETEVPVSRSHSKRLKRYLNL